METPMKKRTRNNLMNINSSDSDEVDMNEFYTSKKNTTIREDIQALWTQKPKVTDCSVVWDIENCQVKRNRSIADICESLDDLSISHNINIKSIYAIGNSFMFRHGLENELTSKGIIFDNTDCKKANISDVKIASKINEITLKNPPPYTIVLISGDSDFSCTLDLLNTYGYSTILIYSDLAKSSFIQKATKSISWSQLLESPKYEYDKSDSANIQVSRVNPISIIRSGESKKLSNSTVHFAPNTPPTSPQKLPSNKLNGKWTCIAYKFGSEMYGQYTIPDNLNLNVDDFIVLNDTKSHYAKWNIGRVQKMIYHNGNIDFDSVIDIISDKEVIIPKLKRIIGTNQKFLQVAKYFANSLLPESVSIVHTEMRCDGNNVTIYYTNSNAYNNFEINAFISKIRDICKMYVYMERRIPCIWKSNCKRPFCNYYHTQ
jgi:hypothetical protein